MKYKIILDGFDTKEQAKQFLNWYEGAGEQSFGVKLYTKVHVLCDVHQGMIEHPDGWEYKVHVYYPGEEE